MDERAAGCARAFVVGTRDCKRALSSGRLDRLPKLRRQQRSTFQAPNAAYKMIRAAFLQSIRCTSRTVVRSQSPISPRTIGPCLYVTSPKFNSLDRLSQKVRWYSAPAGLSKPEVEGRILDLLKGFDKVGGLHNVTWNED